MRELWWSRRKKDFIVDWFNGEGKGGQHRNKRQCCCRLTDRETGIQTSSQEHRSATQNKKAAFLRMVDKLKLHYAKEEGARRGQNGENMQRIRNYNAAENRVTNADGTQYSYGRTVGRGDISEPVKDHAMASISPVE